MTGPVAQARLRSLVARAQAAGRLPSVVAGLAVDGGLVWVGSAGAVAGPVEDTQYRLGSITKTFTAVLVMQAVGEGLLGLDDPIGEAPYPDRTLRELLSHSAGIPAEPSGDWWERSGPTALKGGGPLLPPGAAFSYSNLGYGLLGRVVEAARGEEWGSLVRNRILDPLGMDRTTYRPVAPRAVGYSVDRHLSTLTEEPCDNDTGPMAPAGQLWSTLTDLATYSAFLIDGHPDVLPADTIALMQSPMTPGGDYGLGFQLVEGGRLVGHTGTMPGFMAKLQIDRARRTTALVLANATIGLDPNRFTQEALRIWAEGEPAVPATWAPSVDVPAEAAAMAGFWYWGHRAYEATWQGERLTVRALADGEELETFTHTDSGWTDSLRVPLEWETRADGTVAWWRFDTYLFTRLPYEPGSPVPSPAT